MPFRYHRHPAERAAYIVGALLLLSGLTHVAILVSTGGSWLGPLSLRKPATFGLSFGLTVITIAWVTQFLKLGTRTRSILLTVFTAAAVLETALVSLQAWRGVPSHFNVATPFDASVTRALAAGGVALVATIVAFTLAAFRANDPDVPASMRIAIRTGFLALCAAMAIGGVMIARGMRLVFAGNPKAAYWTGGSLRPMHAVTMHGVLVLPVLAWLLSFGTWSERTRARVLMLAAGVYVLLVAVVCVANLTGAV